MRTSAFLLVLLLAAAMGGCGGDEDTNPTAPDPVDDPPVEPEPIVITDTTGKEWDVSYAAGGEPRAYSITSPGTDPVTPLILREVVNDQVGDVHLAATY